MVRTAMLRRIIFLAAGTVLLSGCVAVWGGAYKVETQSPDLMTIHYDTTFIDPEEVVDLARTHCEEYGKDAVLQTKDKSPWGLTTATFSCVERSQTRP